MYKDSAPLQAKREQLLQAGVLMMDPAAVYVEEEVTVGAGTLLLPGTILRGRTVIGENCQIGPQVMLTDCTVGQGCTINASQCEESTIEKNCQIGPYTHIRPHCVVGEGSHIGAFVQLKNSVLGKGTKMAHLTYVGDSDVGDECNFGCGTITCNYDGFQKHRTTIGSHVFVGCNTNLVPPVQVGDGAFIAAATTVTRDVPPDALAVGRQRQQVKEGWAAENRRLKGRKA
ncbi:DapH/DapD/GlmU-related protein [Pseudoflavonifractor sp. 60]|uniref:DapH/DapD/GlmU-related protein n=1 Tax=Pseudoflavonifractor sp. 60 TaxID=2304576 RepID=UPI001FABAA57|nr:DapH/DapD/GlmU-related protein [Pseudoflavonifractor sp. 60]